ELVGVVDGVDDDCLKGMTALFDFGTSVEEVIPGLHRHLVDVKCVQAWLGREEKRVLSVRAEGRLADLRLPVHENRKVGDVGLRLRLGGGQNGHSSPFQKTGAGSSAGRTRSSSLGATRW